MLAQWAVMNFDIRPARPNEGHLLWQLAMRAKAAWGYDRQFMDACADELFPSDLSLAGVAQLSHARDEVEATPPLLGFYTLEVYEEAHELSRAGASVGRAIELGHLFIEPSHWRRGVGRALMRYAAATALDRGYSRLIIQGDPNAANFYVTCGARRVGTRPSHSIVGRVLPLFELELTPASLGS